MKSELEQILKDHNITFYRLTKESGCTTSLIYNLKAHRHNIGKVKVETFVSLKEALETLTGQQYTFRRALRLLEFKPKDLD